MIWATVISWSCFCRLYRASPSFATENIINLISVLTIWWCPRVDLIGRVPDELWMEDRDIVQDTGTKTIPMEKKCKKAKWLSGEALQIAVKRREAKSKGEKERYKHLNAEFQWIARRDKKPFFSDQCKEIKETTEWERLEISSRKLEIPREHFMQRWAW